MADRRCNPEISEPAKCRGKSMVMTGAQWSGIVSHLHRGEAEAKQAEQNQQYAEYLKKGSRAMTQTWDNTTYKLQEKKTAEKALQEKASQDDGEARYKALTESDKKKRMEQIAIAQQMMDRVKNGPRQLDSAYLMSEVLATRDQQRKVRADEAKAMRVRQLDEGKEMIAAAEQHAAEMREVILSQRHQQNGYKRELFEQMQTANFRRQQATKMEAVNDRKHREAEKKELQTQLEMERMILQRKKETLRRNALEAMQMAEQRRHSKCSIDSKVGKDTLKTKHIALSVFSF